MESIIIEVKKLRKELNFLKNKLNLKGSGFSSGIGENSYSTVEIDSNTIAKAFEAFYVDTRSGSIQLSLPLNPQIGDSIRITDAFSSFEANSLIVVRNGSNIQGQAENLECDVNGASFDLIYTNNIQGWVLDTYINSESQTSNREYSIFEKVTKDIDSVNYVLLESDFNKILNFTSDSDITVTVPNFGVLPRFEGKQLGLGQITFVGETGVEINVSPLVTNITAGQYAVFGLDKISNNNYVLFGDLELI